MNKFFVIATLALLLAAAAAPAFAYGRCDTDCWIDWQGNQHCTTRCF